MSERSLKVENDMGPLVIVKGDTLADAGVTGIVASGKYLGTETFQYKGKPLVSYSIRDERTNTLYKLNRTKALDEQLGQLKAEDGALVKVVYAGCEDTKSGNRFHQFEVFVIDSIDGNDTIDMTPFIKTAKGA